MRNIIGCILILLSASATCLSAEKEFRCEKEDPATCSALLKKHSQDTTTIGERIITIAKEFVDAPYKGKTLEDGQKEKLILNLQSLDCTTFVESVLALARTSMQNDTTLKSFAGNLAKIRYRDGKSDSYADRLHYFSDWIMENSANGIITEIKPEDAIKCEEKKINFMTSNAGLYPPLKDKQTKEKIAEQEKLLSAGAVCFVPKEKIPYLKPGDIQNGDIVAILTDIEGLDFAHIGFAYIIDGEIHLFHASSAAKKVIIDERTLTEYLNSYKSHRGIRILRPQ